MVDRSNTEKPPDQSPHGLTRREVLKKGALLGGALVWATPVVQAIGIQPAHAQEVSPGCEIRITFGNVELCIRTTADVCACIAACDEGDSACVAACLDGAVLEPCG